MGFMEKLEENQKSYTENGAVGYKTTGHKIVDLNFAIPSFRTGIDKDLFELSLKQDEKLTLKWLLYLRDVRKGVGERKSFRDFVMHLVNVDKELAEDFLSVVPIEEYGRWDDYVYLLCNVKELSIRLIIFDKVRAQYFKDLANMNIGQSVSLLGKWLPSENSSSKETKHNAKFIRKLLDMDSKTYRKNLSALRKHIDVVERKMSANDWKNIRYENVPSKANLIYSNAFFEHDTDRRKEYLESLKNGETKINAQALFLHDIVHKYSSNWYVREYDETLEQMWKAQDKVNGFENTIVVRDGSGSMTCNIGNSGVTALDVANAITLYCAENNTGEFKNKFITFSARARLIDVSCKNSLLDKLELLRKNDDCSNTNIENVFNLILDTAIKNNMSQNEMPKTVLIISDMELDAATNDFRGNRVDATLFDSIAYKFETNGYKLPKLVFWNVNSRTNTIPLTQNENGVILISGFSKNLMNMVMSSELDPYKALVNELESERYSIVDKIYK